MTAIVTDKNGHGPAEAIVDTLTEGVVAPARISEADMAYHRRVMQQNAAIPGVREQINGLQQTLMGIDGASRSWLAHLQETYDLSEGDQVKDDGTIVRAETEKK